MAEAAPEAAAPAPPPDDAEKVDEDPEKKAFMADLFGFMRERGTPITKVPQLGHREIDLYTLYKQVTARGGIQKVIENKLWKEVAEYFSFPSTCTNASFILRINYIGYLYYYEQVKFWGVTEPPPPPASLGRIPNRKDFPLPPLPARSPAGSRRTREERAQSDDEGDDSGDEAPAPKTRAAAQAAAVSAPQAATPKIPAQPLSMPVYQPAPNIPLGAPVNRPRTGLEALPYALQSGPDFLREWATQILLNLSAHSDARLTHVTGLLTALAGRLRAELELLKREDLASQGFSVGYASRQAAQRLSTVLRNIALSPQADLDMAAHAQCVQTLLQTAECADDVVRENVVEALAALAPHLAAAEAAAALPHLLRALREGLDAETYLHAILQLSISPKVDALFLLADAWRGELLSALTEHLYSSDPALVLLAIQVLYNLSVSGGTTHVAQHLAIVKQLVRFVAGEVRGQSHHEEIARKSALLLFSFSKTPGVWHRELRRHEEDLVAGAALLGATPTGAILLNLVNNLAGN